MFASLIIHVLLMLAALLYIVPAATDSGVAIRRNSAARGILGLVVIALANNIFWHFISFSGTSSGLGVGLVEVGIVGWLVNAFAILATGRIMPGVLYVRSFGSALGASAILVLVGWLTSTFLF
jgi:uncharacterized membrane protein YvlD (DUF360 family)